jgi:hypothetical protein
MNSKYYIAVRPRTNENHPVHKDGCPFLTDDDKRIYLGSFGSAREALKEGELLFDKVNSCSFCCKEAKKPVEVKEYRYVIEMVPVEVQGQSDFYQGMFCCVN